MDRPLLDVLVTGPGDVAGAQSGGADRLVVAREPEAGGRTPLVDLVSRLRYETDLPLRVLLRANSHDALGGADLTRLQAAATDFVAAGVDGFVLGFVDVALDIDLAALSELHPFLGGHPWAFSSAFDAALDSDRAWRDVLGLPGLDGVVTAGSPRGVEHGLDDLCRRAASDPAVAELVIAGPGLQAEHVPWLSRAGVRAFSLSATARPAGHWRTYVDAALVRSWRTLIDDAHAAARAALHTAG